MVVTESPMVTEASEVHPKNAEVPMVSTEPGMVTEASEVHPSNALFPMDVKPAGSETAVTVFPPHLVFDGV